MCRERGVDLAWFDAESTNLDLKVVAGDELQSARRVPANDVTRSVHSGGCVGGERVGHEPVRCQSRIGTVSPGDSVTGEIQLAGDTPRHRTQPSVQDVSRRPGNGIADRDRIPGREHTRNIADDRRFGGTVRVEESAVAAPGVEQFGWAGLTADHYYGESVQSGWSHRGQGGRSDEGVGDRLTPQELGQFVTAVDVGRRNDHRRTRNNGEQQLQNRRVETRRRESQRARGRCRTVAVQLLGGQVGQACVGDDNPLGPSGRARCVDDVRRVLGPQRSHSVVDRDLLVRLGSDRGLEIRLAENRPGTRVGQAAAMGRGGQTVPRTGVREHVLDAIDGIRGVHRHECRAGFRDRPQRENGLHRSRDPHRNDVFRSDSSSDEHPRDPRRSTVELGVRERSAVERDRVPVRVDFDCRTENLGQQSSGAPTTRTAGTRSSGAPVFAAFGRSIAAHATRSMWCMPVLSPASFSAVSFSAVSRRTSLRSRVIGSLRPAREHLRSPAPRPRLPPIAVRRRPFR